MKTRKYLERVARCAALMLGEIATMSDDELDDYIGETRAFELMCQLGGLLGELQNA